MMLLEVMCSMQSFCQTVHTRVCTWICPDSVHKTFSLKYGAQNTVIHPTLNDSVMLLIILLHFKLTAMLSVDSKSSNCVGIRHPSLKKGMFLRHKSFAHFYSCLGTFEYSCDLQAKKGCVGELCGWFVSFCLEDWEGEVLLLFLHFWRPGTAMIEEC